MVRECQGDQRAFCFERERERERGEFYSAVLHANFISPEPVLGINAWSGSARVIRELSALRERERGEFYSAVLHANFISPEPHNKLLLYI